MKQIIPILCLLFCVRIFGLSLTTEARLKEDSEGSKLILLFRPRVPSYTTTYVKKRNATVLRWKGEIKKRVRRSYIFPDPNSKAEKAILTTDPDTGKGMVVVWHRKEADLLVSKADENRLVLTLSPITRDLAKDNQSKKNEKEEKLITVKVKDTDTGKLLRSVAAETGRSITFSDAVEGTVSIDIQNMKFEDAVDAILKPTKYRAEHFKDVSIVRLATDMLILKQFQLKYVDVNDVIDGLRKLAPDARITADPHTNTVYSVAIPTYLKHIEGMLNSLDRRPKQVEVESAIVEILGNKGKDVGVNLAGNIESPPFSAPIETLRVSPFDQANTAAKALFVGLTWRSVNAVLGALATDSQITLLSRPRILAINDQTATFHVGSKLGYKTVTITDAGSIENIEFLDVGTLLRITPHITENNDIVMHIEPEISDGSLDPVTGVPSEATTTSSTKVIAKDGQTVVIGGLLRDRTETTVDKVPILGDIPLLGFFFRGERQTSTKSEIMILLSPKIVSEESLSTHEEEGARLLDKLYDQRLELNTPPQRFSTDDAN